MKLGAKHTELVQLTQKFVPRSHVGILCNERTQSTPLDLNYCFSVFRSIWVHLGSFGAFACVWVHLGSFRYCMKLGAKRAELVQLLQKFVQRSRDGIFHNERTRSTPLDPKPMFWSVS